MSGAVRLGQRPAARLVTVRARWQEVLVLGALALFAVAPLVALLRNSSQQGLVFAGSDSPFPADQFQYETWIHQFADGRLAANLLDTAPSAHVFLHPMFFVSGALAAAGASVHVAYLVWKPVAIVLLFLGFRAYVWRLLDGTWQRVAALAIALFFVSPLGGATAWLGVGSSSARADLGAALLPSPALLLWGYLPAVLAVALMPVFLLGVERLLRRSAAASMRAARGQLVLVSLSGLLVSWLHPWQGEVLVLITVAALALGRSPRDDARVVAVPVAALFAPLLYYFVLSRADDAWRFAQQENAGAGHYAAWAIAVALLPLVIPALAGVRRAIGDFQECALVLWLPSVLAVYLVFSPSFPQHAFEGVALPLGILAVRGLARLPRPLVWGILMVVLLVVPGTLRSAELMRDTVRAGALPFYLQQGDDRAITYLAGSREKGAVLSSAYFGSLVAARTGRKSWVGHPSWTPGFRARASTAQALLGGKLTAPMVRQAVLRSQASFVFVDCGHGGAAPPSLRPLIAEARRFGCAGVYRVTKP